jgi:NAD+ synthetase
MKIALCQINPIVGDFEHNASLILQGSEEAKDQGCALAVFPEMSLAGYPPKDLLERPAFIEENLRQLNELASHIKGIQVLCGFVDYSTQEKGKSLTNSVALLYEGQVRNKGGKRLLPTYDVFDEARYFESGPSSLVFKLGGQRIGVTICEDIWNLGDIQGIPKYNLDPVSELNERGIDLLINIAASPYTLGKGPLRKRILEKVAHACRVPTLYCNQYGGNDDLLFDGLSMAVDEKGRLVLIGEEFAPHTLIWDSEKKYEEITDPWPSQEASLLKGLTMGTRDYAVKCGFEKVLIGLSGGIDSSLVATIAQKALGPHNVMGISMPSPFTSTMSREDASALAKNLEIEFEEIPINRVYEGYQKTLDPLFTGLEEDETEENIQARIRGNFLMALSNKFNALLLSTGNKSELAMGYCTLYGDMSGGLAVISDIPKTLCYELAEYINRDQEIIPRRVIARPPSAELRPNQTDQDTLPPYEILDDIIEGIIVENLGLEAIVARGHEPDVVRDVFRRLALNEYKRRQAPPGLKVTTKAFGYGRRYPIACANRF